MTVSRRRPQRLGQQIREEISNLLLSELKDPRIGFTTITGVRLTPDLRQAHIYVSVLGTREQQQQTLSGLIAARAFIRHELAQRLRVHHVPELRFELDSSIEYGAHIEELIEQSHRHDHDEPEEK